MTANISKIQSASNFFMNTGLISYWLIKTFECCLFSRDSLGFRISSGCWWWIKIGHLPVITVKTSEEAPWYGARQLHTEMGTVSINQRQLFTIKQPCDALQPDHEYWQQHHSIVCFLPITNAAIFNWRRTNILQRIVQHSTFVYIKNLSSPFAASSTFTHWIMKYHFLRFFHVFTLKWILMKNGEGIKLSERLNTIKHSGYTFMCTNYHLT
jgi:hypothetical protein